MVGGVNGWLWLVWFWLVGWCVVTACLLLFWLVWLTQCGWHGMVKNGSCGCFSLIVVDVVVVKWLLVRLVVVDVLVMVWLVVRLVRLFVADVVVVVGCCGVIKCCSRVLVLLVWMVKLLWCGCFVVVVKVLGVILVKNNYKVNNELVRVKIGY